MRIVFNLGGSILCPEGVPDLNYIKRFSRFAIELKREKHDVIVVTGGGGLARKYIESARTFKPPESFLDLIGILGTRMNAMLLIASLGEYAYERVVKNREDLQHAIGSGKIVVMGGTTPGQTTDAVTIAVAELLGADLVIIGTDVDGIYDRDPKKYKRARLLEKVDVKELKRIVRIKGHKAKPVAVIDPVAVKLLEQSKIKTVVLNGRKIDNMRDLIEGRKFVGTVVGE